MSAQNAQACGVTRMLRGTARLVTEIPMQIEDGRQSGGPLAAMSPVRLISTTTRSSNQDVHILQQQLQHVTAELTPQRVRNVGGNNVAMR